MCKLLTEELVYLKKKAANSLMRTKLWFPVIVFIFKKLSALSN